MVIYLPALCRKMGVPYCIIKGKWRLGNLVRRKNCTALAITQVYYIIIYYETKLFNIIFILIRLIPVIVQLLLSWWSLLKTTLTNGLMNSNVIGVVVFWVPSLLVVSLKLKRRRKRNWHKNNKIYVYDIYLIKPIKLMDCMFHYNIVLNCKACFIDICIPYVLS